MGYMKYYFKINNPYNETTGPKITNIIDYAKHIGINLNFGYCFDIDEIEEFYIQMMDVKQLEFAYNPQGMTNSDIENMLGAELSKIGVGAHELTIVDNYIFAFSTDENLLIKILEDNVISKKIKFVTDQRCENATRRNNIEKSLISKGFTVQVIYRNDIHDRWWLTDKAGFLSGTSFNGIGKKASVITPLTPKDLSAILKTL